MANTSKPGFLFNLGFTAPIGLGPIGLGGQVTATFTVEPTEMYFATSQFYGLATGGIDTGARVVQTLRAA